MWSMTGSCDQRKCRAWIAVLALGLLGAIPDSAHAQTGGVAGRVTNAQSGEPVAGAQVVVTGTSRGVLTRADGRYEIANLRPGGYALEVRSVGFRTARRTVQLADEQNARLDFEIAPTAVLLDEVVITGQAATGRTRRTMGHSMVTILASELENAPVTSLAQLIQSRAPGVTVLPAGGKAGQGSRIILRGVETLTQAVQPLVFVDGVRTDNSTHSGVDVGGPTWTGLDDFNTLDVDRVEILCGVTSASRTMERVRSASR